MNLPNILTLFRIGLLPVYIIIFYLPFSWAHFTAAVIFTLACVTDLLDGYLARSWDQTSKLGAFLDPVADKLLVAVTLVLLVSERDLYYIAIPAAIIVSREIVISALREWMAEMGARASIAVTFVAKFKTAIQMFSLGLLIAFRPNESWLGVIGLVLLYLSALLTIWSMFVYLKIAWPELTEKNDK